MSVDSRHRLVEPLVHDDRFGRDITPPTLPEPTPMPMPMADGHCISKYPNVIRESVYFHRFGIWEWRHCFPWGGEISTNKPVCSRPKHTTCRKSALLIFHRRIPKCNTMLQAEKELFQRLPENCHFSTFIQPPKYSNTFRYFGSWVKVEKNKVR